MTPKLKALSLIESMSFSKSRQMNYANGEMVDIPQNLYAKQCAMIAVDEILISCYNVFDDFVIDSDKVGGYRNMKKYWTEVKQELEKL